MSARLASFVVALGVSTVLLSACSGGSSPTSPTPAPTPTPAPAPTPSTVPLTGLVTSTAGVRLAATVTINDGPNAGRSVNTDGSGTYRFDGLTVGNANLGVIGPGY